jgi:CBS domain-containing protein
VPAVDRCLGRLDRPVPRPAESAGAVLAGAVLAGVTLAGTVADAMVTVPKVCGVTTTVGDLRALFDDEHVHAALVVEQSTLLAVVERADVERLDDGAPARTAGRMAGRVVAPTAPLATVHREMMAQGRRRLAVVDDGGRLLGLLCLKQSGTGFCSDADVRSRADERLAIARAAVAQQPTSAESPHLAV